MLITSFESGRRVGLSWERDTSSRPVVERDFVRSISSASEVRGITGSSYVILESGRLTEISGSRNLVLEGE